ncbi:MAG: polymer-forming cytoskeletal protein [Pseudomonadota bacterium]
MFSKNKISDTPPGAEAGKSVPAAVRPETPKPTGASSADTPTAPAFPAKPKPSPSLLSSDLTITGNVQTSGDIQVEGKVEGDVRAHLLTVGEGAVIAGEIVAEDVVVNGKVVGRVRGLKVRLTASAVVEGDIVHKTIAIESGAHFEGSVQRNEDPLGDSAQKSPAIKPKATSEPPTDSA